MNRVIETPVASAARRNGVFIALVGITALVAALSTALCMRAGIPIWGMFAGWIVFVTGGGSAKAGFAALGSALLGLVLGLGGGIAMAAATNGPGSLAVPIVVFAIVALAMLGQRAPLFNSVICYFIGMTVYFASALAPTLATFVTLSLALILGTLSGLLATILANLVKSSSKAQ